jgi:hypothetical protein
MDRLRLATLQTPRGLDGLPRAASWPVERGAHARSGSDRKLDRSCIAPSARA